jgi:hypothetical protein
MGWDRDGSRVTGHAKPQTHQKTNKKEESVF